jgi:hypothetical protein
MGLYQYVQKWLLAWQGGGRVLFLSWILTDILGRRTYHREQTEGAINTWQYATI